MKIAVVTASGIGDGLILHIASHNLVQMEHEVITFNDHLAGFGEWFRGYSFSNQPLLFAQFDAVILQHDNSPKAKQIRALDLPVYTFYGSHQVSKHGALRDTDYVANPNQTMVDNITKAMEKWFGVASKENGMTPLAGLVHRKYPSRVAIHTTSGAREKNWPQEKFYHVAKKLQNMGYDPVFINEPGGRPIFASLEDLASFIYESGAFLGNDSGPGHIASYLKIPSLIIGKEEKQMRLWRPGWMAPEVLTPPAWSAHWKWTRNKWKHFITTRSVIKTLKCKVLKN
jgi:ADP-heptose:LPS heptosyltransferase